MHVVIVRHAIALDREVANTRGVPEADRPLTDTGRKKMIAAARGLTRLLPRPDLLASSPWLRARQSADLIADAFDGIEVTQTPALLPGHLQHDLIDWLLSRDIAKTAILVGHEPDLGLWAGWLLSGRPLPMLRFKKASACLIAFDDKPAPGHGELRWLLTPRQLRELGGCDSA